MSSPQPITAVLGAGAWGTTLACLQAGKGRTVRLWARRPEFAAHLARNRENRDYLPGTPLPEAVAVTGDLRATLEGVTQVIVAVPSHGLRGVMNQAVPYLAQEALVVCATKGLERPSGRRMSQVLDETLQDRAPRIVALSGPNLSAEIIAGEPAVSVAASDDMAAALEAQELLSNSLFRVYTNSDIIGVELCGAIKNVIAIGAGICHGLGLGNNTMAALITRGLAEITRLAVAMGGRPKTLAGLAGLGDLVLTCTGALSRNRQLGTELAKGRKLDEILASMRMVAEGVETTTAAVDLARLHGVEMPITEQMYAIMRLGRPPREAIRELMERSLKGE